MPRKLKGGILKGFLEFTKDTEIPEKFSLWTGVSTISAILSRDVFVDMGFFTIFPNTYIVLIAGSARCHKSTAIRTAVSFMKATKNNVRILSQKMTPEKLISDLSGTDANEDNILVRTAEGILVVDELSTLIDKNAFTSGLIPILTKLYDSDDFSYATKSRGVEEIVNPCLSILGGSTLHWIKESIPKVAIGGGFTSRVIFVYQEAPEKLVPFPYLSDEAKKLKVDIVNDLNDVGSIRGEFRLSKQAKNFYEDEYVRFTRESKLFDNVDLVGYAGRRDIMMLKLAMIVSASVKNDMIINYDDIRIAKESLDVVEKDMPKILKSISSEFVGNVSEEVLSFIIKRKEVYRSTLVRKMTYKLTAQQLSVILDTLSEYRDKNGNPIIITKREGDRTKYIYTG